MVGQYCYLNVVIDLVKSLVISGSGWIDNNFVIQNFLYKNRLNVEIVIRGYAWLYKGTKEAMNNLSNFIKSAEDR